MKIKKEKLFVREKAHCEFSKNVLRTDQSGSRKKEKKQTETERGVRMDQAKNCYINSRLLESLEISHTLWLATLHYPPEGARKTPVRIGNPKAHSSVKWQKKKKVTKLHRALFESPKIRGGEGKKRYQGVGKSNVVDRTHLALLRLVVKSRCTCAGEGGSGGRASHAASGYNKGGRDHGGEERPRERADVDDSSWQGSLSTAAKPNESEMAFGWRVRRAHGIRRTPWRGGGREEERRMRQRWRTRNSPTRQTRIVENTMHLLEREGKGSERERDKRDRVKPSRRWWGWGCLGDGAETQSAVLSCEREAESWVVGVREGRTKSRPARQWRR